MYIYKMADVATLQYDIFMAMITCLCYKNVYFVVLHMHMPCMVYCKLRLFKIICKHNKKQSAVQNAIKFTS